MNSFTADPANPRGRRSDTGSLAGSGTHDEHSAADDAGEHDIDVAGEPIAGTAQEAGAGATELAALIVARDAKSR